MECIAKSIIEKGFWINCVKGFTCHFEWENTEIPEKEILLKIAPFHLMKGKDPKAVDKEAFNMESRDFTFGGINNIWIVNEKLLISYNPGLSDEEYEQAIQGITGFQEILRVTRQKTSLFLQSLTLMVIL